MDVANSCDKLVEELLLIVQIFEPVRLAKSCMKEGEKTLCEPHVMQSITRLALAKAICCRIAGRA